MRGVARGVVRGVKGRVGGIRGVVRGGKGGNRIRAISILSSKTLTHHITSDFIISVS